MSWFARTAVTKSYNSGGRKSNIKVCAGLDPSAGSERESVSCPTPSFWWSPAILGLPGLGNTALRSLPLSSQGLLPSACLCPEPSLLMRTRVTGSCVVYAVSQPYWMLCSSVDCSPPGFSVHGISWARVLDRVAICFSRRSS